MMKTFFILKTLSTPYSPAIPVFKFKFNVIASQAVTRRRTVLQVQSRVSIFVLDL